MYFHEEYILRHNLNVPIVCYDKKSSIFLKSTGPVCTWKIFNITWNHVDLGHPGSYEFKVSEPRHNSLGKNCFNTTANYEKVFWDMYFDKVMYFLDLFKSENMVAVSSSERTLALWQMFLNIYDGWLAENMNSEFFTLVERSTRNEIDINTRTIAFRRACGLLYARSSNVYCFLEDNMMSIVKGHSVWLERLING